MLEARISREYLQAILANGKCAGDWPPYLPGYCDFGISQTVDIRSWRHFSSVLAMFLEPCFSDQSRWVCPEEDTDSSESQNVAMVTPQMSPEGSPEEDETTAPVHSSETGPSITTIPGIRVDTSIVTASPSRWTSR